MNSSKKNPSSLLLGAWIVIAAAIFAFFTVDQRKEEDTAVDKTTKLVPDRETPRRLSRTSLQPTDVVKMSPQDWTNRFQRFPSEVSAEYEEEIVSLAEELSEILRENPDPNGMEALVFSEAILTLHAEGRSPD
ncbi:MAG: hypothetical protein V4727_01015 [Verrucomicrobiota bacterium]